MQVSKKTAAIAAAVCIGIGAVIGSKWGSQIETQIVTKDRVVTQIKEVTRPDGTVVRDTTRVEDRQQAISVTQPAKKDWTVTALYGFGPAYGVGVSRRILGDFSVGVQGTTKGDIMATLSYQF